MSDKNIIGTKYWQLLNDERVICNICPRTCKLKEGQRGFCFVRSNEGGQIVLNSYGLSSGYCIDPIEKKPLNHFLPGTPVLSFGTAGCNLLCKFCQNWNISKSREMQTLAVQASPQKIARVAHDLACRSVAYTYNDPVIFMEYALDVSRACREYGIKSVAVTAGYMNEAPRREFYQYMDAANVDLKSFNEDFYAKICGGHLQPVLDTLRYIKEETETWLELTTLLIPNENDGDEELHTMSEWVVNTLGSEVPWHFTAFHPDFKMNNYPRTPASTLLKARAIAMEHGISYVYIGNVHHPKASNTFCSTCGTVLIGRIGYTITEWKINASGLCSSCGNGIPGFFEEKHGDWGEQRQMVDMNYACTDL